MTQPAFQNRSSLSAWIPLDPSLLAKGCEIDYFSHCLTIYGLIPPAARLGWKIEIYDDIREIVPPHFHQIRTQLMMVLEGAAQISFGSQERDIGPGQFVALGPHHFHKITPKRHVRLLVIDSPPFNHPEDIYLQNPPPQEGLPAPFVSSPLKKDAVLDQHTELDLHHLEALTIPVEIPKECYLNQIKDQGYDVYLLASHPDGEKWGLAILDVNDAPKHFHKIGHEHFMVLNGELDIQLEGINHILKAGQSVHIPPGISHHLKSAGLSPVRLLCVNFPAFDPKDFYPL